MEQALSAFASRQLSAPDEPPSPVSSLPFGKGYDYLQRLHGKNHRCLMLHRRLCHFFWLSTLLLDFFHFLAIFDVLHFFAFCERRSYPG